MTRNRKLLVVSIVAAGMIAAVVALYTGREALLFRWRLWSLLRFEDGAYVAAVGARDLPADLKTLEAWFLSQGESTAQPGAGRRFHVEYYDHDDLPHQPNILVGLRTEDITY